METHRGGDGERPRDGGKGHGGTRPDGGEQFGYFEVGVASDQIEGDEHLEGQCDELAERHDGQAEEARGAEHNCRDAAADEIAEERFAVGVESDQQRRCQNHGKPEDRRKRENLGDRNGGEPLVSKCKAHDGIGENGHHDQRRPIQHGDVTEGAQVGPADVSTFANFGGERREGEGKDCREENAIGNGANCIGAIVDRDRCRCHGKAEHQLRQGLV
ncbi:hypothetical protein D3C87_1357170 [compost metagenome]